LQETGIGKTVNAYRKHHSQIVGNFARHLVTKWKQLVQLTTEAASETHCPASAPNDSSIIADTGKEAVASKADHHYLGNSSSKNKCFKSSGNNAGSERHSSIVVEPSVSSKEKADKLSSSRCSKSKVPALLSENDQSGYNNSHNHSASQLSVCVDETIECKQLLAGGLSSLNSEAGTCSKSCHEKHHKLSKHGVGYNNKEKCSLLCKLHAAVSMSASHGESHMSQPHCKDTDGCTSDKILHKHGKQSISEDHAETNLKKSVTKDVSKCKSGHKGSEKKALNTSVSGRESHSSTSVSSGIRTHGHMSKHQNYADVESFLTAEDMDAGESKGMTFEQMLNYDNHSTVARKKKQSIPGDSKHTKGHKIASHISSCALSSMTQHANKPHSGLMSKHYSHKAYPSSLTAENGELEMTQLKLQPVIPHPDSQVGADFCTFCKCLHVDIYMLLLVFPTCN